MNDDGLLAVVLFLLFNAAWIGAAFLAYFLPGVLAYWRGHPQAGAIFVLNLFLGWTVIFWILALVWTMTNTAVANPQVQLVTVREDGKLAHSLAPMPGQPTHTRGTGRSSFQLVLVLGLGCLLLIVVMVGGISWIAYSASQKRLAFAKKQDEVEQMAGQAKIAEQKKKLDEQQRLQARQQVKDADPVQIIKKKEADQAFLKAQKQREEEDRVFAAQTAAAAKKAQDEEVQAVAFAAKMEMEKARAKARLEADQEKARAAGAMIISLQVQAKDLDKFVRLHGEAIDEPVVKNVQILWDQALNALAKRIPKMEALLKEAATLPPTPDLASSITKATQSLDRAKKIR